MADEKPKRKVSAGGRVEDLCRSCKMVRPHTVMTAAAGVPLRVVCDYCNSHHNYRGGGPRQGPARAPGRPPEPSRRTFPLVSDRERSGLSMSGDTTGGLPQDLESMLRRVIREESGLTPVAPADKWRGGDLVLRPGREGIQEKSWPIETFFHKVVMLRNRLRALEQQINAADLPSDVKAKVQGYITACYGSLTSFNLLFADEGDRFRGAGTTQ
jgi:hypothetical protein